MAACLWWLGDTAALRLMLVRLSFAWLGLLLLQQACCGAPIKVALCCEHYNALRSASACNFMVYMCMVGA